MKEKMHGRGAATVRGKIIQEENEVLVAVDHVST
jgi:hypothetical protein